MAQSRTRFIGMDVHKESIAVAYVAHTHGAEVASWGAIGTRQCDIEQLLRKMQAKATPLICVSEAGSCGSWLSRSLTKKGYDGWVVAPSLMPKKAGDRGPPPPQRRRATGPPGALGGSHRGLCPPRWKMQRSAISPGHAQRPSALSKMPSAGSKPFGSGPTDGTRAGPPGTRSISGGSLRWCAQHRRSKASFHPMSAP